MANCATYIDCGEDAPVMLQAPLFCGKAGPGRSLPDVALPLHRALAYERPL